MHPCRIAACAAALFLGGIVAAQTLPPAPAGAFDFSYRIAGDKRVAPIQVFDDGRQTYLQFRAGQVPPAVFSVDRQGERLAPVSWQGGYAVVAGTASEFLLRIGGITARAQYQGRGVRAGIDGLDRTDGLPPGLDGPPLSVPDAVARPVPVAFPARPAAGGGQAVRERHAQGYDATPTDRNMRQALRRWAAAAGWTFEAEHWTVDVDIPLAGSAALGNDFKAAVRGLLAATELSAHPLQPCFYSNRVLRVIRYAESCDRTATASGRQG